MIAASRSAPTLLLLLLFYAVTIPMTPCYSNILGGSLAGPSEWSDENEAASLSRFATHTRQFDLVRSVSTRTLYIYRVYARQRGPFPYDSSVQPVAGRTKRKDEGYLKDS
jgi:hypothetical protein